MYTIGHYMYVYYLYIYIYYLPDLANFPQAAEAQSLLLFCQGGMEKKILKLTPFFPENWWLKGDVSCFPFGAIWACFQKGQVVGLREDNIPETKMLYWEMEKLGWLT